MAKQAAVAAAVQTVGSEAFPQDTVSDVDSDLGICKICEVNEQENECVWILQSQDQQWQFAEQIPRRHGHKRRCNWTEIRGARETSVGIADTSFKFKFRIASVTKPIASTDGFYQAGCTTVISKFGGLFTVTPSGQVIVLHRRQRACSLQCGVGSELKLCTVAAVRASPEVQRLPAAGRDADEMSHTGASASTDSKLRMEEPELIRETDKDMLEVSGEAGAASAPGIPVVPPFAGRQKHRLVHLPKLVHLLRGRKRTRSKS